MILLFVGRVEAVEVDGPHVGVGREQRRTFFEAHAKPHVHALDVPAIDVVAVISVLLQSLFSHVQPFLFHPLLCHSATARVNEDQIVQS